MGFTCIYCIYLFSNVLHAILSLKNLNIITNIKPNIFSLNLNPIYFDDSNKNYGNKYFEEYIKNLNSRNITIQNNMILNRDEELNSMEEDFISIMNKISHDINNYINNSYENVTRQIYFPSKRNVIIVKKKELPSNYLEELFNINQRRGYSKNYNIEDDDDDDDDDDDIDEPPNFNSGNSNNGPENSNNHYDFEGGVTKNRNKYKRGSKQNEKSENFEVISKSPINFTHIGGYDNVKLELYQCVDMLTNYKKYQNFNVRLPKGMILEGPPGNGKTLLAKGFAGEAKTSFIPVSGSQFQEKYVGVGSSRVRELFELAKKNIPCIIFIDEVDAIGKKRSSDGESSSSERDSTLNELLVSLDGFKTVSGIFLMCATNRADLLDPALLRPGRIDKRIYIGNPDAKTREEVIKIHLKGKPYDSSVDISALVDLTAGLSCAQIENLLNEAMLNALRYDRFSISNADIDSVINKIMVGWQPNEHKFSHGIIERIAIHEMGHAIVGFLSKHHSKVSKVVINLSSPTSPGYTMFETSTSNIYIREALFEHLMILLAGRIAEEVFYGVSVTTGAINDFEEAFKLAEKMIIYYGMGKNVIYPRSSDKYKELIDDEVANLINNAYALSSFIVKNTKDLIYECAEILKNEKILKADRLTEIIVTKYPDVLDLKIEM